MYQKVRILKLKPNDPPTLLGKEFWVKAGPPQMIEGSQLYSGYPVPKRPAYITNIISPSGQIAQLTKDEGVELLAEFAEEVELVKYSDLTKDP